jgi:peroxiredoxin
MAFVVSFSQLFLAAVFAVAAFAKLADRGSFREAIVAFRVPRRFADAGTIAVPVLELGVAAALIAAPTARAGAAAAVALLAIFSGAIVRALRFGSAPDCNCFGGITQTEVGRGTLIRNLALMAVAVLVIAAGQSVGALHWLVLSAPGDRPLFAILVACITALSCFCWAVLRQNGRLLHQLDGYAAAGAPAPHKAELPLLEAGVPAPDFDGHDLAGEPVSLSSLLAPGLPVVLFFTDPGCGACELVLDAVVEAQRERADKLTVAVLSAGSIDRIKQKAADFGLDRVVPQEDDTLLDTYGIQGFPALLEIDPDGFVAGPPALGAEPVRAAILRVRPTDGAAGSLPEVVRR